MRRLAAILAADVVGFSALMERDEERTLARIRDLRQDVIEPNVQKRNGRVVKTTGDGILIEFTSPVEAVRCATQIQESLRCAEGSQGTPKALQIRIGINLGDILVEPDGDIYGDGVNLAARLEQLAVPGGILISDEVHRHIAGKIDRSFADRGEQQVKNIARPVRVYELTAFEHQRPDAVLPLPDKPSIAVLPFTNLSGDPEQEYFADGIAEEITTALGRLRGFFVIARNSAFTYKGHVVPVQQVGRDLGVRYVLEGSVRKTGDRVRVGVQLAHAATGREIWSERYDRPLLDIFALQDEIAANVVVAVEPQLYAAERDRVQQKQPESLDAWDCVIRALWHMWLRTKDHHEAALHSLNCALRLDPNYARALGTHSWLSLWHAHQGWSEGGLASVIASATERARFAVSVDEGDAWARVALGFAEMFHREHESSVEELRAALDVNPNFALAHACLSLTLAYGGRGREAVEQIEKAMRLSPRDPFVYLFAGVRSFAHYTAGDLARTDSAARPRHPAPAMHQPVLHTPHLLPSGPNAPGPARPAHTTPCPGSATGRLRYQRPGGSPPSRPAGHAGERFDRAAADARRPAPADRKASRHRGRRLGVASGMQLGHARRRSGATSGRRPLARSRLYHLRGRAAAAHRPRDRGTRPIHRLCPGRAGRRAPRPAGCGSLALLLNARQMLERWLVGTHARLSKLPVPPGSPAPARDHAFPRSRTDQAAAREVQLRRIERHAEVQRRRAAGQSIMAIARAIPLAPGTVRRYISTDSPPERGARAVGPSGLDPWLAHLERRLAQGCENGLQLLRELRRLGYEGGARQVHKWLQSRRTRPARNTPRRWREPEGEAAPRSQARLPGPKALAWIMAMPQARQRPVEGALVARVLQDAEAAMMHCLVQRFAALVREAGVNCCSSAARCAGRLKAFETWAADARACGIRAAQTFAAGLVADGAAVRAALTTPWSNAQAEGQITKLKLIKRLMYGRAGFDLLRRRVLLAA